MQAARLLLRPARPGMHAPLGPPSPQAASPAVKQPALPLAASPHHAPLSHSARFRGLFVRVHTIPITVNNHEHTQKTLQPRTVLSHGAQLHHVAVGAQLLRRAGAGARGRASARVAWQAAAAVKRCRYRRYRPP